jgi:branched-chain amino acid transport system permease protein
MFDEYIQSVLIFTGISIIAAYSFYVPFKTGQISLGQAGFMAIGAYGSSILTAKFGLPFPLGLLVGGLLAGVIGIGVGFPALRIKGIYLLLLTLGFAEIIQVIILTWDYTGGAQGFQGIPYLENAIVYIYAIVAALVFFFARLERSSLGRAMDSIHEDETAAEVMGVDVVRTKLLAFGLGAFIAGLAGALLAHYQTYVDQATFHILVGVEVLMFVLVGGGFSYWGPLAGAVFLSLLPEFLRALRDVIEAVPESWTEGPGAAAVYEFLYEFLDFENEKRLIVYGAILIVMMIVRPQGFITRDTFRRLQFVQRRTGHV